MIFNQACSSVALRFSACLRQTGGAHDEGHLRADVEERNLSPEEVIAEVDRKEVLHVEGRRDRQNRLIK